MTASGAVTGQVVDVSGRTVDVTIPYNVVDSFGTVWLPGCFTRSLQAKLPPVVMNHDVRTVVGRVKSFRDTATALHLTIQLADPDAVPNARAAQSLLREGVVDEVSFRYVNGDVTVMRGRFGTAPCFRSATVQEVSFVTIGSVPGARVLAVRSADEDYQLEPDELAAIGAAVRDVQLEQDVVAALAKLTLRGHHRRATAGVRASVELAERDAQAAKQAAAERARQARLLAAQDAMPLDPDFTRDYFGTTERLTVDLNAAMPDFPPHDVLRAVVDAGEMTNEQAVAAWRQAYGKTEVPRAPDAPNAQGIQPYPPQDMIDAEVENGLHRAEVIRRWRVHYGFEQA